MTPAVAAGLAYPVWLWDETGRGGGSAGLFRLGSCDMDPVGRANTGSVAGTGGDDRTGPTRFLGRGGGGGGVGCAGEHP